VGAVRTLLQKLGFGLSVGDKNGLGYLRDKRRAQRLPIAMPVLVYGYVKGDPFAENSESINVSARGGLVAISAEVSCWEKVIVTNLQTDQDLKCRIVRLVKTPAGQILAGLEFPDVEPRFWRTGTTPLNY
jgi:hypothetical protein